LPRAAARRGRDSRLHVETLSNRGVSVKSSGGSGLPAFEYEMFSVPPSARLSVTAMVRPVNPTLAFSKKLVEG